MTVLTTRGRTRLNAGEVLTSGAVARLLGCSPRSVNKWIDDGELPGYRLPAGRDRRILRTELVAFLRRRNLPLPASLGGAWTHHVLLAGPCPGVRAALEGGPAGAVGYRCLQGGTVWEVAQLAAAGPGACAVVDAAGLGAGHAREVVSGLAGAPGWRGGPILMLLGEDNAGIWDGPYECVRHPWGGPAVAAAVRAACEGGRP